MQRKNLQNKEKGNKNIDKKSEKFERSAIVLLIVASLIFLISVGFLLVSFFDKRANYQKGGELLESREFYASVNVTLDRGGFDLNKSALTFGKIILGGSATRNIIFENKYNFAVYAKISASGDITKLLSFNDVETIRMGEIKKISFSVSTNNETMPGFYEGKVKLDIYPAWVDIENK